MCTWSRLAPTFAAFIIALPALASGATGADHYAIQLELVPEEERLRAETVVSLGRVEPGRSEIVFCLNNGLEIESVEIPHGARSVTRRERDDKLCPYSPAASPVEIAFERPATTDTLVELRLVYSGPIEMDVWTTNRLTAEWIELGMYSAWFPRFPNRGGFTYDVEVSIDPTYSLTGTGKLTRTEHGWRMTQSEPTFDVVLIGAPGMELSTASVGGRKASVYHTGLDPDRVRQLGRDVERIMSEFSDWFGETSSSSNLTIALAPRMMGGGYARPGFIVMSFVPDSMEYDWLVKSLAHEFAHFWWSGAPVTSWEDWMNEAFAEYASLMLVRELYGCEAMEKYLDEYRLKAANRPPIWGIDRNSEHAYFVLYYKGALVLRELEKRLGRAEFLTLLREMIDDGIHSTDAFLDKLATVSRPETRAWMEGALTL